jgi:hypothetical protein
VEDRKKEEERFGSKIHGSSFKVFKGDCINDELTFSTKEIQSPSTKNL